MHGLVEPLEVRTEFQTVAEPLLPGGILILVGGGLEQRVQDDGRVDRLQAGEAAIPGGVCENSP